MSGHDEQQDVVARLDAIHAEEREHESHVEADRILEEAADPEVRAAYRRVQERAGSWWYS